MKRKGAYLLCFFILPILLITTVTAHAVSNPLGQPTKSIDAKIEKYKVKNGNEDENDLERYRVLFERDEDWNPFGKDEVAQTVNNVSNFFFSMNKLIVSITDYAIEHLYQLDVLDDFADKVGQFVGDIYEKLLSNIVLTLFIIVCLNAFIAFTLLSNPQEALKRAFLIFCLVGFGIGILANASNVIKVTNNIGKGLNNVIMNSTSSINDHVDYENESSGLNKIRNQYFDMTLYKPYLIMNYGTVNEEKIKAKNKKRIDDILDIKVTKKADEEKIKDIISDDEIKKYNNTALKQTNVFGQLGISIFTFVITIFISVIFVAISFAKLIFSTFALILFIFLVFSWLISFIPNFEISVFKALSRTLGYIILSACMTFLFVVVGFCIDLADAFIKPESQSAYFLNMIFLMIVLFVMYKKRSEIIDFVSRGNISFSPRAIGEGAIKKGQDEFNKRRKQQATDKQNKRKQQQSSTPQPVYVVNPDGNSTPRRNQQDSNTTMPKGRKDVKRRSQQEEMAFNASSDSPNTKNQKQSQTYSNQDKPNIKRSEQYQSQDQSLERQRPKEVKRSSQSESQNHLNPSAMPKEVRRSEQSVKENNIEKRRIQSGQDKQYQGSLKRNTDDFKRNRQELSNKDSETRLKSQKDINKHGK